MAPRPSGNNDVTDFSFATPAGRINYTFPLKFNYGSLDASLNDGASGDIKIKVSEADELAINIDYLMPIAAFTVANKWWIYDPDVSTDLEGALQYNDSVIGPDSQQVIPLSAYTLPPNPPYPPDNAPTPPPPPFAPGEGGGGGGAGVAIGAAAGGVVVLVAVACFASKKKSRSGAVDPAKV